MLQGLNWRYYNHAIIPTTAPHERVDESPLKHNNFWKSIQGKGYPFLARWTMDFDCQEPTDWWYIIKDKPFDIMEVKKNYRRKIRKGLENFDIRVIDPTQYIEELYQVEAEAIVSYHNKKRQTLDYDRFVASLKKKRKGVTFAAFSKEDKRIAGYCYDIVCDGYILGSLQKAKPSQEIKHLNAALVYSELDYFSKELAEGFYISAGERNILHETNFQDYLVKYFRFRKAYCRLHIRYRRGIKQLVACLYPIRSLVKRLDSIKLFYQISSVLKMEEIARKHKNSSAMNNV